MFDLDGTLINSLPDISASMNRALEKSGLAGYPQDDYKYMVGDGVVNLTKRAVKEREDCFAAVYAAYCADYAQNSRIHTYVYDGVHDLLGTLAARGLSLCVVSNKDDSDVKSVLNHFFPYRPFAVTRGRVEGVPVKPDAASVNFILDKLSLTPDECLYLGDTATDMKTAHNARIDCAVGALWGFRTKDELISSGARYLAQKPMDVPCILSLADAEG